MRLQREIQQFQKGHGCKRRFPPIHSRYHRRYCVEAAETRKVGQVQNINKSHSFGSCTTGDNHDSSKYLLGAVRGVEGVDGGHQEVVAEHVL